MTSLTSSGQTAADTPDAPALPLAGLRVVEIGHMVMGPTCGLILGELGADVIKLEPLPGGDKTRTLTGSGAGFFVTYNRNKRSLALDFRSPAGLRIARQLIAQADVMIENLGPGSLDRMGLGWDEVRRDNERLIHCSMKGFLGGPYEKRTALDEVVQMMGGLAYMTGPPGRPLRAGASVNDVMGGMFAAIAVLAALRERDVTGRGQQVRSALFENNTFLMAQHMAQYVVTGQPARPMPARLSAWAIYDVFTTSDDEQLFVGVVSDTQWRTFCDHFELTELLADPAFATNPQRVATRERFMPRIADLFRSRTKADLMAHLERLGIPYAPIARPEDLFDDPHLNQSGGLVDVTLPDGRVTRLPALPIELNGHRPPVRRGVPRPGEHSRELMEELGYAPDDIDQLVADGIIGG